MDEIRRALVLGLPALGALGLAGCVSGEGQEVSSGEAGERAFAQGLLSNSALTVASGNSQALGTYFNGKGNLGTSAFKPNLNLNAVCLKGGNTKAALRLNEVITRADGSCVYRTLALALSGTSFKGSPRLSLSKTGAVVGKFLVHGDDDSVDASYTVTNSGTIQVINPIFTNFFYMTFDKVKLVRSTSSTEVITLSGTVPVRYVTEEEPYPYG